MRGTSNIARLLETEGGSKEERLATLRRTVERLQCIPAGLEPEHATAGVGASLAPGLPGPGFVGGVLNEAIAACGGEPAAFGFLFALMAAVQQMRPGPVVFVAAQRALNCGIPYGRGLAQLGVDVGRLILADPAADKDVLWALEESLRSKARPAMVVGVIEAGLDLMQSRRLNLAAAVHATPLVVLGSAAKARASAAATRWRIAPAPAALDHFGTFAGWRWHATLERCRNGRTGAWLIEWDAAACRFRPIEQSRDGCGQEFPAG